MLTLAQNAEPAEVTKTGCIQEQSPRPTRTPLPTHPVIPAQAGIQADSAHHAKPSVRSYRQTRIYGLAYYRKVTGVEGPGPQRQSRPPVYPPTPSFPRRRESKRTQPNTPSPLKKLTHQGHNEGGC